MSITKKVVEAAESGAAVRGGYKQQGLSLRGRLILLVAAAVLPLLILQLGHQYADYRHNIDITAARTLALARGLAQQVEGEIGTGVAALTTLATSNALLADDLPTFRERAVNVVESQFPGANIILLAANGQILLSTAAALGAALPVRENMDITRQVFATGKPGVSNLFYGALRKQPVVAIDVPVRAVDGSIRYVLSMNPRLDVFADVIEKQRLPDDWVVSVFDRNGVIVARVPNGDKFVGHPASASFIASLQSQAEGTLRSTSLEGVDLLSGFSHDNQFGWAVGAGVSRDRLLQPVFRGAMGALAIAVGLLLISLALALYAARRIAGPINLLRQLASTPDDDIPPVLRPTGLPEIDEVAAALYTAEAGRQRSRAAERLLRDSIGIMPEGFAIFDAADRLIMCNESYRRLFPRNADQVTIGATFAEMIAGGAPDGADNAEWIAARLKEHSDPNALIEQQLPGGRWALIRNRMLPGGGLTGLRIDITALKQVEQAFRRSEERFRSIFGAVGEGIFIVERGNFTEINEAGCAMFGYLHGELIGRDIGSISSGVAPYTQQEAMAWHAKATATGQPQRFEWHCKAKDGRLFWAEVSLRNAIIASEDAVLAVVRDITERQKVEAQLRQAQKMEAIGNLTGGMAHDFNNLLGVIVGNLDLAKTQLEEHSELGELVDEAYQAAWRGADLTRRLLAFARRQPLRQTQIEINELVQSTVRLLNWLLGEDIEVFLRLADDLWPVVADPAQLESSLANLANNARDAMPGGGRLIITTANRYLDTEYVMTQPDVKSGDYVLIEVTDTGTGMSPETASQIFEPFFTTKETGKGTGLGLSMVFGFLKQSGGHVTVYSELDRGTTFRLYLPRAAGGAFTAENADAKLAPRGAGEAVLLVEDNAGMRRVAVRQLRELGYRVLECERAAQALDILQREHVDLLFTDIVMAGELDGVELARMARERLPSLKILLTSGFPQARIESDGLTTLPLLSKPYRREQLAAAVRAVLDGGNNGGYSYH